MALSIMNFSFFLLEAIRYIGVSDMDECPVQHFFWTEKVSFYSQLSI